MATLRLGILEGRCSVTGQPVRMRLAFIVVVTLAARYTASVLAGGQWLT